jgi:hypothetical protein
MKRKLTVLIHWARTTVLAYLVSLDLVNLENVLVCHPRPPIVNTHSTLFPCLGIPPELVILEHGSDMVLSLRVEPGRSLNLTCESQGQHAGDVIWTESGGDSVTMERKQMPLLFLFAQV